MVTRRLCKKNNPVLVTAGEYRIALTVTRALGRAGIPVAVLASERDAMTFVSKYCAEKILTPPDHQKEEYLSFLEALVKRQEFSGLIFCDDLSIMHIGEAREAFRRYVPFMLPNQKWLQLAVNKIQTLQFVADKGIDIPPTVIGEDVDQLVSLTKGMNYPLVVKGTGGDSSRNVQVVRGQDRLRDAIELILEMERARCVAREILVQEYVTGPVYSAIVLCNEGAIVNAFMMRKLLSYPSWGGICIEGESFYDEEFRHVINTFFTHIPWHGIAEVEFVKDRRDGRLKLIELTNNFNWALDLSIACGVNFPLFNYQLMCGEKVQVNGHYNYRMGERFLWLLPEGILYMRDHPSSIPSLALKVVNPFLKSDLRALDFRPVLNRIRHTAWILKTEWKG